MKRIRLLFLFAIFAALLNFGSIKAFAADPELDINLVTYNADSREQVFEIIREAVKERLTDFYIILTFEEDMDSLQTWVLKPFKYKDFCDESDDQNDYYFNLIGKRNVNVKIYENGILLTYTIKYRETKEETEDVEAFIKKWQKKNKDKLKGKSKTTKLKMFYDYIVGFDYDYDLLNDSPYSLVEDKKGTCMSYAGLLQKYCDMNKLECHIVCGENESGVKHAYNIIKIKNKWYGFDSTNDLKGEFVLFKYKDWQNMTEYPLLSTYKNLF